MPRQMWRCSCSVSRSAFAGSVGGRVQFTGSGFTVLIVSDDGRRVRRLGVPRWLMRAACGVLAVALLANLVLIAHYTSLRRARAAGVAAPSQVGTLIEEQVGAA